MLNLVKSEVHELLSDAGFTRRGNTWNRERHELIDVVNIQTSNFGVKDEGSFTINLGIFHADIWMICWGDEKPVFLKETDCIARFRIGEIVGGIENKSFDIWWDYASDILETNIQMSIHEALVNHVLIFFDKIENLACLCDVLLNRVKKAQPMDRIYKSVLLKWQASGNFSFAELEAVAEISEDWARRVAIVKERLSNFER